MLKSDKPKIVAELQEKLQSAKSINFIDFTGMDIKAQQALKRELKGADSVMLVAKNTLLKLASKAAKLPSEVLEDALLKSQTAVILSSNDPIDPIQVLA